MPNHLPAKNNKSSLRAIPTRPGKDVVGAAPQAPEEPAAATKYKQSPRSYRFQRSQTAGVIEVLNENSYIMAEYSERTGAVRWRRVVLASERDQIENRLKDHYPPRAGG